MSRSQPHPLASKTPTPPRAPTYPYQASLHLIPTMKSPTTTIDQVPVATIDQAPLTPTKQAPT